MKKIDLNADIAEGFPFDRELLNYITSANICTGAYAGSRSLASETAHLARSLGVRTGLHIGFPDHASMGRRFLSEGIPEAWIEEVIEQIEECSVYAYIKAHGALYHWLMEDVTEHNTIWIALEEAQKAFMGMAGTMHEEQCRRRGLRLIPEGFAERRYTSSLRLVPRSEPDAVLTNLTDIVEQSKILAAHVESICIHGDHPNAVAIAQAVRFGLEEEGFVFVA
jgi:5-oxoprolinase (ATP-hydrolysing) subunit A